MSKSNKVMVTLADQSAFKPQLTVVVRRKEKGSEDVIIDLVHPNTKEVVYSEEFISKEKSFELKLVLAINFGKELLKTDKIKELQREIEYVKQIFIPQGKRGRVKLKTKERVEESERISKELPVFGEIEKQVLPELPKLPNLTKTQKKTKKKAPKKDSHKVEGGTRMKNKDNLESSLNKKSKDKANTKDKKKKAKDKKS